MRRTDRISQRHVSSLSHLFHSLSLSFPLSPLFFFTLISFFLLCYSLFSFYYFLHFSISVSPLRCYSVSQLFSCSGFTRVPFSSLSLSEILFATAISGRMLLKFLNVSLLLACDLFSPFVSTRAAACAQRCVRPLLSRLCANTLPLFFRHRHSLIACCIHIHYIYI